MSEIIDINEIKQYIPHRYPFLLVDRIVEIELNPAEKAAFDKSCGAVQELIDASKKLVG